MNTKITQFIIKLFFSVLLIVIYNKTLAQWEIQQSGVSVFLRDVFFLDYQRGWAVGDSGVIIFTTTGGETWNVQYDLPDSIEIKQVQFIDNNIGFIGGDIINKFPEYEAREGVLLQTTDGGLNWEYCESISDSSFSFAHFEFRDANTGWISLNNSGQMSLNDRRGILMETTNAGSSWTVLDERSILNGTFAICDTERAFSFWSPFFDSFDDTYVFETLDRGQNWNLIGIISNDLIKKVAYVTPNTLWAIGYKTSRSYNSGIDWDSWDWFNYIPEGQKKFIPQDLGIIGINTIWIIGDAFNSGNDIEGRLMKTVDLGDNWEIDLQIPNYSFSAIFISEENKAWIVGSNGLIIHANDIMACNNNYKHEFLEYFFIGQNYPNPFNSLTIIEYYIPKSGSTFINVFDVRGRSIKKITRLNQKAGLHRIEWDGIDKNNNNVPSGIYICEVVFDNIRQAKKLVLIR